MGIWFLKNHVSRLHVFLTKTSETRRFDGSWYVRPSVCIIEARYCPCMQSGMAATAAGRDLIVCSSSSTCLVAGVLIKKKDPCLMFKIGPSQQKRAGQLANTQVTTVLVQIKGEKKEYFSPLLACQRIMLQLLNSLAYSQLCQKLLSLHNAKILLVFFPDLKILFSRFQSGKDKIGYTKWTQGKKSHSRQANVKELIDTRRPADSHTHVEQVIILGNWPKLVTCPTQFSTVPPNSEILS